MAKAKLTPQMVLEQLGLFDSITIAQMAEMFDCSEETVRNRLRTLRKDGSPIIHSANGISLIDKEWLSEFENSRILESFVGWMLASMKAMYVCAGPVRPLLPTMRRALGPNYSKEDRHQIMKICAKVASMIAYVETEEEVE